MNLTRAIKLLRLFSSKSSTPAGACLLRLVIENFLEMTTLVWQTLSIGAPTPPLQRLVPA